MIHEVKKGRGQSNGRKVIVVQYQGGAWGDGCGRHLEKSSLIREEKAFFFFFFLYDCVIKIVT